MTPLAHPPTLLPRGLIDMIRLTSFTLHLSRIRCQIIVCLRIGEVPYRKKMP